MPPGPLPSTISLTGGHRTQDTILSVQAKVYDKISASKYALLDLLLVLQPKYLCLPITNALFMPKWAWFKQNVGMVIVSFPDPTSREEKGLVNFGRILGSRSMAHAD